MPQRSQTGERPTGMSSAGFPCLEFGSWSAGHGQGFVLHCQRWRLSSCGVASLFLLNLGVVGYWGDVALDLQYRDFIHNPKSLHTVPFTESQPALYYWKTCSSAFLPKACPSKSLSLTVCPLYWERLAGHTRFGPERVIATQKEKALWSENGAKVLIQLEGNMQLTFKCSLNTASVYTGS